MPDESYLDRKYFVDSTVYNCPFCNRNNVPYSVMECYGFDWTESKRCFVYIVKCDYCENKSMHLSFTDIYDYERRAFSYNIDIDSHMFYSRPTSFFTMDNRIPAVIRELITEAEGCLKMNYLTGASACTRKAIYEFTQKENAEGKDYESKIKSLKVKFSQCEPDLFDILAHIQDMTSEKVHEQSWPKWDSGKLQLIIETLKTVLHEIYVLPVMKQERAQRIRDLRTDITEDKKK